MAVIYRFAAKYINSPDRLFADQMALRGKITPCQVETGPYHLGQLLANMKRDESNIKAYLKPYIDTMRSGVAGVNLAADSAGKSGAARKLFAKAVIAPQIKLFAVNNYSLTVNEEPDAGGLFRLELKFESTNAGRGRTLAHSDPLPAKGVKTLNIRAGAQAASAAPASAPSAGGKITQASAL